MNRVELKNKAKELIKGNKWYIWQPSIIFGLAIGIISGIALWIDSALGLVKQSTMVINGMEISYRISGPITTIVSILTSFVAAAFSIAYAYYILSFIRGKRLEMSDIVDFMKKHWLIAFLVTFLTGLIALGCSILLIIPGIIASVGLCFFKEVCADNPELKSKEIIKKTWEMTKGHKMDLFVLGLSFIGWYIVAGFTFGILLIWLVPYMVVTFTLAYEELKK